MERSFVMRRGCSWNRSFAVGVILLASVANAAALGSGLISWVQPIILFLGGAMMIVALVTGIFRPQFATSAAFIAFILVVVFFLLRNMSAFQQAVQS
jgi:hypothetical protein